MIAHKRSTHRIGVVTVDTPTTTRTLDLMLEELGQSVTHVVTYEAGDGTRHAVVRTKKADG